MSRLKRIVEAAIAELLGNKHPSEGFYYSIKIMNIHCIPPPENVIAAIEDNAASEGINTTGSVICIDHIFMESENLKFGLFGEFIQGLASAHPETAKLSTGYAVHGCAAISTC